MTVQERILALRLLEDAERDPDYARRLGLTVKMKKINKTTREKGEDSGGCI